MPQKSKKNLVPPKKTSVQSARPHTPKQGDLAVTRAKGWVDQNEK
jgi:hypothetical protein